MTAVFLVALTLVQPPTAKAAPPARPPVAITVRPAGLPVPLLRVELIPHQTDAGDALPLYLAAMQALPRLTPETAKAYNDAADDLVHVGRSPKQATPADLAAVRKVLDPAADALRLAARAARVRTCDWSALVPPPPAGMGGKAATDMLASSQGFRELTRYLTLRIYLARAAGDVPGALADVSTVLGMARHVGSGESLIQHLVGNALAAIALGHVRDMVSGGECPNLLPAVLVLPRPLIPAAPALRRELGNVTAVYPPIDQLDRKALTAAEAKVLVLQTHARTMTLTDPDGVTADTSDDEEVPKIDPAPARKALAALGYDAKLLAAMPADQLFLLDAAVRVRRQADGQRLAGLLPAGHPLAVALPVDASPPLHPVGVGVVLMRLMTPAASKVREAQTRMEFDLNALAFTEALRAELAKPGAAWGPELLNAPLVKAAPFPATWDAAAKVFRAERPTPFSQACVWTRGE